MKKLFIITSIVFVLIGFNEIKSFNNTMDSIKAVNQISHACSIDMQKDNSIICD